MQTGVPPSFPPPTWESYGTDIPSVSQAVFGQLTWPLADSLRLTTGLRFTRDTKTYHYGVRSTGTWTGDPYDSGMLSTANRYSATTGKLEQALARKSLAAGLMVLGAAALAYLRTQMPVVLLVLAHPKHRDGSWSSADGHQLLGDARTIHTSFDAL